jgi:hypothetical protein
LIGCHCQVVGCGSQVEGGDAERIKRKSYGNDYFSKSDCFRKWDFRISKTGDFQC